VARIDDERAADDVGRRRRDRRRAATEAVGGGWRRVDRRRGFARETASSIVLASRATDDARSLLKVEHDARRARRELAGGTRRDP
jgi:hypothetical protein